MNLAQSALSRRISELEYELGNTRLFIRSGKGLTLTPSGVLLQQSAARIMSIVEETREQIAALGRGMIGHIRLGFSVSALHHRFFEAVLRASYSSLDGITIELLPLTATEMVQQLRSGEIQASMLVSAPLDPDIQSMELAEEAYHLVLPLDHPLSGQREITFDQLLEESFIWLPKSTEPDAYKNLVEAFRIHGGVPRIAHECPTVDTALRWVACGIGLTFVPGNAGSSLPLNVTTRPVEGFSFSMSFRLAWLDGDLSPATDRLIQIIAGAVEQF